MNSKKNIVYLGCPGFPYGLAEVKKMTLIAKGLIEVGNNVTIISRRSIIQKIDYPELKSKGNFEGIDYIYTSGTPFRNKNFIKRNLLKIKGTINELILIRHLYKQDKLDVAILSTHSLILALYYAVLARFYGFKTLLNYVEFSSGIKKNGSK